jgi:uncharacterized membrane protein
MAEVLTSAPTVAAAPSIRRIGFGELRIALERGWKDFLEAPTQLVFLCILYPIIGIIAATLVAGGDAMHLFYPMAAGFALVGPIAALGMYEISRRREQGLHATWLNVFDVARSPAFGSILGLAGLLLVLFLAWVWIAHAIYGATVGQLPRGTGLWEALGTAEGWRMLWLGNLVGFGFAAVVLVLTAVSFPMLLDRNCGVAEAVATSARAFAVNPVPMAAWGLIVAAVLFVGSLPLFVGLAVALPVLGHATWHLYRLAVRSNSSAAQATRSPKATKGGGVPRSGSTASTRKRVAGSGGAAKSAGRCAGTIRLRAISRSFRCPGTTARRLTGSRPWRSTCRPISA